MKTRVLTIIGLCVCLLVSCTSERTDISTFLPKAGETVKITAYADGAPQTKTGLVDKVGGGKSVVWKSGNAISLFFNSGSAGGNKFTTWDDGPIAEFTGSISAVSGNLSGIGGSAHFWGVYPYNSITSCDGQSITTTLQARQKAYQGDVADNLLVTVGRSIDLSIHFKNACSVVGFTVSQEGIKKIVFSGNAEESVAGEFNISFDENEDLVDVPTSNAVDQIIITPAETTTFEPGVTYYFAILPGTFSAGYSLTFTKSDYSEATFTRETSCTFKASTFYTMTGKDEGLTFVPSPIFDENIVFADSRVKAKLVAAFDTDEDGELSYAEAAAVTSIEGVFGAIKTYKSFDEFQYFTGVTTIPYSMFANWNLLTSIILPESIQEIGDSAFEGCVKLSSIEIPESVTFIGYNAFSDCSSLTSVAIPEGVQQIWDAAFAGCSRLSVIEIPESVTWIGSGAFNGCSSLGSVVIPAGVTSIGGASFEGCNSLTSVIIPDGVPAIYDRTFYGCSSLTSIEIPESVTSIGNDAFSGCSGLAFVVIPASVTWIGHRTFSGCSSLVSIEIPECVTYIGNSAFSGCSSLTSIVIPESVSSIGNETFWGCSSLTSVVIPESVSSIGDYAFSGCSSLTVEIPESVTSIGYYAFSGLISITILAMVPPQLHASYSTDFLGLLGFIYVPDECVDTYRTTDGWSDYARNIYGVSKQQVLLEELASEIDDLLTTGIYTYYDDSHSPNVFIGPRVLYQYPGPRNATVSTSGTSDYTLSDALPEYFPTLLAKPMSIAPTHADSVELVSAIKIYFHKVAVTNVDNVPYLKFIATKDNGATYYIETVRADLIEWAGFGMRRSMEYLRYKGILKTALYDNKGFLDAYDVNEIPDPANYYDALTNLIDLYLHFIGEGTLNESLYDSEDEYYSVDNL